MISSDIEDKNLINLFKKMLYELDEKDIINLYKLYLSLSKEPYENVELKDGKLWFPYTKNNSEDPMRGLFMKIIDCETIKYSLVKVYGIVEANF